MHLIVFTLGTTHTPDPFGLYANTNSASDQTSLLLLFFRSRYLAATMEYTSVHDERFSRFDWRDSNINRANASIAAQLCLAESEPEREGERGKGIKRMCLDNC